MAVVDRITAALPTAVVFVATIPRTNNFLTDFIADRYNSDINRLLLRRSADGFRVMPVRMDDIAPDEYADRLHPNDAGYRKMSDNWFAALRQAVKRGWVVPAEGDLSDPNSGNPDNGACPDDSGTSSPASSSTSTSEDNSGQYIASTQSHIYQRGQLGPVVASTQSQSHVNRWAAFY
ncbi:hypothetical protein BKA62DRAFT_784900 [Auriculariales sp. MPI-PUGE-AT-0066]|nr:hypothetical protein BKA62DRAFT_784900 [Auriculariales sp. MPI-PUGE-AT-0066]